MPPLPSPLMSPVSFDDIAAAHERLRAQAKRTPVLTSSTVDALTGARVFFKCENFQRMGAFKFRGAYNALAQLSPEEKLRGAIAFSSGNHAQAVALAGKILDVKTLIVMPANAPQVKLDATRGYGAEVVLYQKDEKREEVTSRLAKERNLSLIPPFDHRQVIAGQGTAAKELIEDAGLEAADFQVLVRGVVHPVILQFAHAPAHAPALLRRRRHGARAHPRAGEAHPGA